jgi:flagella basal body P-ring formation protein FlgA
VRCPGADGWTLYVPVSVTRIGPVAVLTRSLPRGATLTEADFRVERRHLEAAGVQPFGAAQLPIGYELRQPLAAGATIGPQHVRPLMVVRRGAQVQLRAVTAGVTVRMQGQALADAAAGARVKARNLASNRVVEGIARPDGSIEVTL